MVTAQEFGLTDVFVVGIKADVTTCEILSFIVYYGCRHFKTVFFPVVANMNNIMFYINEIVFIKQLYYLPINIDNPTNDDTSIADGFLTATASSK